MLIQNPLDEFEKGRPQLLLEKLYINIAHLKEEKIEQSEILEYFPNKYLPRDTHKKL